MEGGRGMEGGREGDERRRMEGGREERIQRLNWRMQVHVHVRYKYVDQEISLS